MSSGTTHNEAIVRAARATDRDRLGRRVRDAVRRISLWLGIDRKGVTAMQNRWRVLVVDDDRDVLDLIRMKLTDEYDVLCIDQAVDVSHASELFEPDLIVLDIMMPKISGYQVIEYLKRNPMTSKVPVCFLSAKASARDLKHGYKLGATLYLTKPFQPDRLMKNVKLLFERTPPVRRMKHFTVEEINNQFQQENVGYEVATLESELQARAVPPRRPVTPPPAMEPAPTPPRAESTPEPDEEDDINRRRRWVD